MMEQGTVGTLFLIITSLPPVILPFFPSPRHGVGLLFETPKDGMDNDGVLTLFSKRCEIDGLLSQDLVH